MLAHLAKRLLFMIPLLFGITLISFAVIHLAPGEPVGLDASLNPKVSAEARERIRQLYHLDEPLPVQYWRWVKRLAVLDLGESFSADRRPVIDKIRERIPITLVLNVLSLLLILAVATPLGVYSAVRQHTLFDRVSTVFVFIGFAIPTFWLALLLMILFGVHLGWLPIAGIRSLDHDSFSAAGKLLDYTRHLAMPVFVSAFGGLAGLSRYMRSNMLEVVRQDYITTARAKGLPEDVVIYRHALRNALLPVVTILGLSVPGLIGGSVIFETIYAIPGMGQLFYQSVLSRDYPLVMGVLVIGAVLTLVGNLVADLCYGLVDPRIRTGQ